MGSCAASGASTGSSCRTGSGRTPPGRRTGGPRPRDAGALGLVRPHAGRRGPRRPRRRVGGRRTGAPRAAAHGAGGHARPRRRCADEQEEDDPGRRAVAREVAAEGTVLLVNDGLLPLDPGTVASVAVVGANAGQLAMGGGSSEVTPHRRRSVADALAERLPGVRSLPRSDAASTSDCRRSTCGCWPRRASREASHRVLRQRGASADAGGDRAAAHGPGAVDRPPAAELTVGRMLGAAPRCSPRTCRARWQLGLESAGRAVLRVDGAVVVDNSESDARFELLRRRERARRGRRSTSRPGAPTSWRSRCGHGRPSSPILGARIGASRPDTGDEFERAVARRRRGRRRRGRGRLERAMGVRGARPARPVAAGPSAGARRGGARGQPAHRGRRQRRLPGRDALGAAGRCRAHDLVPGRGGCRRAGRHAGRRGRARRGGCR